MSHDPHNQESAIVRHGAVAVIVRDDRLLLIRRSQQVIAPGMYCFPGGGIEPGETEQQAVIRELQEELNCVIRPRRRIWESVSPWRVHLAWWLADLDDSPAPQANPAEVESIHWFTLAEMATLPNQLDSNYRFLEAISCGEARLEMT
ncbi:MAG TPA: NUDIX domain-containing protein [Pirellulales bacterium]|jgi:8-oxo-dGTP pyrophosphatase MutT (NUDIX family)|nr:NUDIX domain-containing protein [Pirellulales bacterium]